VLGCGTIMMVAGHEVRDTKPDFITFRCKRCGRPEMYICDEQGPLGRRSAGASIVL
jgi:ribosomal protein S14